MKLSSLNNPKLSFILKRLGSKFICAFRLGRLFNLLPHKTTVSDHMPEAEPKIFDTRLNTNPAREAPDGEILEYLLNYVQVNKWQQNTRIKAEVEERQKSE